MIATFKLQHCCGNCANYCSVAEFCDKFEIYIYEGPYFSCDMWEELRKLEPGEYDGR